MKILIIDSNETRRIALKVLIEQTFKNCIPLEQVNGKKEISDQEINEGWDSIKDACELLMTGCGMIFIHHNDNRQPYWREFSELFLSKDDRNLCVSYSGGDTASQINERHCPVDKSINDNADGLWHVSDFLLSIKDNKNNSFSILTGYDPVLESKLDLLHKCLLASSAPTLKEFDAEFNMLKDFNKSYESFLTKIKKMDDDDIFNPNYIEAVKQLRIALLDT